MIKRHIKCRFFAFILKKFVAFYSQYAYSSCAIALNYGYAFGEIAGFVRVEVEA